MALNGSNNAEKIWNFLMDIYHNPTGVAGLMGNLSAESGLSPINLQNSFEGKLNHTDVSYTKAVDDGSYENFVRDSAGYGLAQWTYWSRKQALLDYIKSKKVSIGDLESQLEFLAKELRGYKEVHQAIKNGKSVKEVSNVVLFKFENPKVQNKRVQNERASRGQSYYDMFADIPKEVPDNSIMYRVRTSWSNASSQIGAYTVLNNAKKMADDHLGYKVYDKNGKIVYDPSPDTIKPYLVKVKVGVLNIRSGPGTNHKLVGKITDRGTYTIIEESAGKGSIKGWGKLKSSAGWISLDNVKEK